METQWEVTLGKGRGRDKVPTRDPRPNLKLSGVWGPGSDHLRDEQLIQWKSTGPEAKSRLVRQGRERQKGPLDRPSLRRTRVNPLPSKVGERLSYPEDLRDSLLRSPESLPPTDVGSSDHKEVPYLSGWDGGLRDKRGLAGR